MSISKIAVLGTGANGAGIGADLVRAGHDVTYIEQWPAHVEAMRANGITVHCGGETTVKVRGNAAERRTDKYAWAAARAAYR